MENIQINGQRRWGPPNDWSGPPPPHGTEVFVKNLPGDVFEEQLYRIFSSVGKVYEVRLPVHWSGDNRGYAFVRFTEAAEADAAIRAFDRTELRRGWKIDVQRSVDNTRLFLSSVPRNKTGEELKKDLSEYVENVKKVYVYPTLEDRNVFRGYAFVEFETHRDAAIAKRILTPDVCSLLFEKKCIAAWANPLPFIHGSLLETLNVLFIRNIPKELKALELKKELKNVLGDDEACRVKRLTDFAFITFKDHKCAQRALDKLKGDPRLTDFYQIQVEWAIPRELVNSSPDLNKPIPLIHDFRESESERNSNSTVKKLPHPRFQNKSSRFGSSDASYLAPPVRTSRSTIAGDRAILELDEFLCPTHLSTCHEACADADTIAAREIEKNRNCQKEKNFYHRLFCYTRDSSLSPTAADSSGSSTVLWNSGSEKSLSPPPTVLPGRGGLLLRSDVPLVNFLPYQTFSQAGSTTIGSENALRSNPAMYFY